MISGVFAARHLSVRMVVVLDLLVVSASCSPASRRAEKQGPRHRADRYKKVLTIPGGLQMGTAEAS